MQVLVIKAAKSREQRAKSKEQRTKSKEQRAGSKEQRAGSKEQRAGSKEQRAGSGGGFALYSLLSALCLFIVFVYGCGTQKHYVRSDTDIKNIKKIAVLPFENFSTEEIAGEKIRRIVIAEIISRGIEVVEPGEVSRLIKDMKIKSISMIKLSDIKEIGTSTGSDAVMTGSVEYYGISRGVNINYPEVTINLRLIETSTGNVLWSIRKTSEGPNFWMRHFGSEGKTLSETAGEVVKDAIKTIF